MDVERVAPALYERLGAQPSADLAVLLDVARRDWTAEVTTTAVDRFERRLTEELASVRVVLADLRTEMHDGDAVLRQELLNVRYELIKWAFAFWVGQVIALGGLMAVMLRQAG